MTISISVVIPVYNAADYVREAVESALAQPETGEVLLVEDGSQDHSLAVCEQLAREYDRVRLLRHPNGENRGAGASRNLGIVNARSDVIAFLDADDYYLPGRFTVAAEILQANPNIDGVYETLGMHYMDQAARDAWQRRSPDSFERGLEGPKRVVPPDRLLDAMLDEEFGGFSGNGMVVRRAALERVGLYTLGRTEDTAMCFQLAALAIMAPGRLNEPVAMYRIYGNNRTITAEETPLHTVRRYCAMWRTLWLWSLDYLDRTRARQFFEKYALFLHKSYRKQRLARFKALTGLAMARPLTVLRQGYFLKAYSVSMPGIGLLIGWVAQRTHKIRHRQGGVIAPPPDQP